MATKEELPLEFGNKYSLPTAEKAAYPDFHLLTMGPVVEGFVRWMLARGYKRATFEITKDGEESIDPDVPEITYFESRIRVTAVDAREAEG